MSEVAPLSIAVINYNNIYFSTGLAEILSRLTLRETSVVHIEDGELNEASKADVIVMNISCGRNSICNTLHKIRKPDSVVIGLERDSDDPVTTTSLYCHAGMQTLSLKNSVAQVSQMFDTISNEEQHEFTFQNKNCFHCKQVTLTPQQSYFSHLYLSGCSVKKMAGDLGCDTKTVYSHKLKIMRNFNIKNDQELYVLLRFNLTRKSDCLIYPGLHI